MRWFRSNQTIGGGLALAALALQLIVSFAHVHPQDVYGRAYASTASIATSGATYASRRDASPSVRRDSRAALDVYCDICASINLAGSSQTAIAPWLPAPQLTISDARFDVRDQLASPDRRYVLFQSRAPPTV